MAQISFHEVRFSYEGSPDTVFENFSISFDTKWNLGLIARNGRGKTTLLKLLSNQLKPSDGSINTPGDITPVMFPPLVDTRSGDAAKNIVLNAIPDLEEWRFMRELSLLNVDEELIEHPFNTLSPGEQGKLLLAALFAKEDAYVVLDEPGNHLDAGGKNILTAYLSGKKGFLLVSHERALLDAVTDHTMALLKSHPEIVAGPYHIWAKHRKDVENFERSENARLLKEITVLEESAKQTGQWADKSHRESRKDDGSGVKFGLKEKNRVKARKLERRLKQTVRQKEKAAEEKGRLLKDIEENTSLKMFPLTFHSHYLINAADLSLRYDNKELLQKNSFFVSRGERICLTGQNGAGKSTLLGLLSGEPVSEDLTIEGNLHIAKGIKISRLLQTSDLPHIKLMDYIEQKKLDTTNVLMLLRKMDLPGEIYNSYVTELSAGQKRKLLLACSLSEEAHIYSWDEPLNFLDIQTREQIEDVLLTAGPTMVFAEHDEYFCKQIATKYIQLPEGNIIPL